MSNGKRHFGPTDRDSPTGQSEPPSKLLPNIQVGSNLNGPFYFMYQPKFRELFRILLTRTITKRAVAWVGSEQPECTVPLNTWNFRNFKTEFLLNGKLPTFTLHHTQWLPRGCYHDKVNLEVHFCAFFKADILIAFFLRRTAFKENTIIFVLTVWPEAIGSFHTLACC